MTLTMTGSAVITEGQWQIGGEYVWHTYAFYDQPRSTCLSDGTYLVALGMEDAYSGQSLARFLHVDTDLTVLGQMDLVGPDDDYNTISDLDYFYGLQIVATSGNHAVMISPVFDDSHDGHLTPYHRTYATWIIDCTSAVPSIAAPVYFISAYTGPPQIELAYHWGAPVLYDPETDRVIVAFSGNVWMPDFGSVPPDYDSPHSADRRTVLQVFQASTGVLLSETTPDTKDARFAYGPYGLWMDPADHTQFSVMVGYTPTSSSKPAYRQFTVSLDGLSGSYDREIDFADSTWNVGGGRSPYDGSGGGIFDSGALFDLSYAQLTPSVLNASDVWNEYWSTQHGYFLDTYLEMYAGSYPYNFSGMFVRINLESMTAEAYPLPYGPLMGYESIDIQPNTQYSFGGMQPCFNPVNGDVAIFTGIYNDNTYNDHKVIAWKFAGPDKPNLTGGPLGVDVYFSVGG